MSESHNRSFQPNIFPAILILMLIAFVSIVPQAVANRTVVHFVGMVGGWAVAFVAAHVWWLIRSGIQGPVRWLVPMLALTAAGVAIALYSGPNLGLRIILHLLLVTILWTGSAVLTHRLGWSTQRAAVILALILSIGLTAMIRIDGTSADLWPETSWRWNPTNEQLAAIERAKSVRTAKVEPVAALANDDWPQFRGVAQESRIVGMKLNTDWGKKPPQELWRRRIGPAWGSCTVVGERLFTQEQRGPREAVVCLNTATGEELWSHETVARFEEAISGVGPRGTPTYADGFVYAFGATGKLCKLDAVTGKLMWEIDAPAVAESKPPSQFWGYASSPYVANGLAIVFLSGGPGKGTAAFQIRDGSLAWVAGDGRHGYSTAHKTKIAGVEQLLMSSDIGLESHDPISGQRLWIHRWPIRANRSTQPILLGNDELLLTTGYSEGTQKLKIAKSESGWNVTVVWQTKTLRPYYNDAVFHNGWLFGFDDSRFVCVDPQTGKQKWNAGAVHGFGQVLLLADSGMLVVQSENGKVHLVEANGDEYVPVATLPAFTRKTWNHPVIARGKLFVRNGEEIACFDVSMK